MQVFGDENGDYADDFYHRYLGDIAIAKGLGAKMFRMSLSWSRILPSGTGEVRAGPVLAPWLLSSCCERLNLMP